MLLLKCLVLSVLFVGTGGAVFTDWGKNHKALVLFAGIVAVLGGAFLFRDLYNELKGEIRTELSPRPSEVSGAPSTGSKSPKVETPSSASFPEQVKAPLCITVNGKQICE